MDTLIQGVIVAAMLLALVSIPFWLGGAIRQTYGKHKIRTRGTAAVGSALHELDRLLARPSIEYKVEAEYEDKLQTDHASDK